MELTECINYLLTAAQNEVYAKFKADLQPFDVTPAQYMVLYFLNERGSLSPSALALLSRLDNSTMTGILTRMERKELIERRHSDNDRRSVEICITKEGAAMLPDILARIDACNAQTLAVFSAEERKALKGYLARIIGD